MKTKIWNLSFLLLTILATIKIFFFNLNIDEEYAITMACRIAAGDVMLLDMWEPHQTSGFLCAALIRLFGLFTGSSDYLVLYLRFAGAIIQAGIGVFMYRTIKQPFGGGIAFVCSIFFYNTLSKWIQIPEFSNMLVWFSVLVFLCLLRYALAPRQHRFWLVCAGIFLSCLVLSYPSCILAVPLYLIALKVLERKKTFPGDLFAILTPCLLLAAAFVGGLLSRMSISQFFFGLRQMMTDGQHTDTFLQRIGAYAGELPRLLLPFGVAFLTALLIWRFLFYKKQKQSGVSQLFLFLNLLMIVCLIQQLILWLIPGGFIHYPLLYFLLLYGAGYLAYHALAVQKETSLDTEQKTRCKILLYTGLIPGAGVWLSALLITNTTISVTSSYLMTGMIASLILMYLWLRENISLKKLSIFTVFVLLGTTLFAKGFMVCETGGFKSNMAFVKQKALSGPAKGIYCHYMEGYDYNNYANVVSKYVQPGDTVLYAGRHSLRYLLGDQRISSYSTISTPTFDRRLTEYWALHPDRYPDVVICDDMDRFLEDIRAVLPLGEPDVVEEGIAVFLLDK